MLGRIAGVLAIAAMVLVGCDLPQTAPGQTRQRPPGPSPLGQWAAVVVGADFRSSDGQEVPIFDNARRDVAAALTSVGFTPQNVVQLSVNPNNETGVTETSPQAFTALAERAAANATGCLFYFSSHGNQQGIVFGRQNAMLDPMTLGNLLNRWCGSRPTVVMISACYSGVFVPALQGPNRMVMTAARPDRTSFGCGGTDRYPYFDECVLQSIPVSADFLTLADTVRTCIQRREQSTGSSPPSEPQLFIGEQMRATLAALPFVAGPGQGGAPPQPRPEPQPPYAQPAAPKPPQGPAYPEPQPYPPQQGYPQFQQYPQTQPYPGGDPQMAPPQPGPAGYPQPPYG